MGILESREAYRSMHKPVQLKPLTERADVNMKSILGDIDEELKGKGTAQLKKMRMVLRSKLFQTEDHFGVNSKEFVHDFLMLRRISLILAEETEDTMHIMLRSDLEKQQDLYNADADKVEDKDEAPAGDEESDEASPELGGIF